MPFKKTQKLVIFVVTRKGWEKRRYDTIEDWELKELNNPKFPRNLKTYMAFKSRRQAMRWVNYWRNKEDFVVIGVPIEISPLGLLIK